MSRQFLRQRNAPLAGPVSHTGTRRVTSRFIEEITGDEDKTRQVIEKVQQVTEGQNTVLPETDDNTLVGDIDFTKNDTEPVTTDKSVIKNAREEKRKQRDQHEERVDRCVEHITVINKEAKRLATDVDRFVSLLRNVAQETSDNTHLCRRLETMRKTCVSFIMTLERQLPSKTTSLFTQENH